MQRKLNRRTVLTDSVAIANYRSAHSVRHGDMGRTTLGMGDTGYLSSNTSRLNTVSRAGTQDASRLALEYAAKRLTE